MTKKADIGSKRLIGLAPDRWAQWVTQDDTIQAVDVFSSDFQWVGREGDVLIRAYSPEDGEFLILNEMQLHYNARIPRRMRAYAALAEEKYQLPVYPVLVNILPPNLDPQIPTKYRSQFRGLISRQDYRVINLWEVEAQSVFEQQLTSLLPFVPILKGGEEESIVREALLQLRGDEQIDELENLLAFFASFVLEIELVRQIMRWDMVVLEQSPWYQEIARRERQRGAEQGKQEGILEGILRGRQESLLTGIAIALELKFGQEGLQLMPEILQLEDVEQLDAILMAIKSVEAIAQLRQIYSSS